MNTQPSVVITGAGIVSALGIGKQSTEDALLSEKTGIGKMHYLKTVHTDFPVGEVPFSNEELKERAGVEKEPTTRSALMGIIALKEALQQASFSEEMIEQTAFISGTTVGGMDQSEQYYLDFFENHTRDIYTDTHDCGSCTEMIADPVGKFAFVATPSTACSSAANALIFGAELIRSGRFDKVVAGGSECLTKFHLNGFNTLMILDKEACRPFDASRTGLNLGEGAAFVVLESEESARQRNVRPLARLSGYGNCCDAFHQTASSDNGEGAYLSMKEALLMAGIAPSEINYINAHGTGTPNNDLSESVAIRRVFEQDNLQIPPVSSTKSFTGHTTSASGAIEAVICLLALQKGFIPANLNWKNAFENGIRPVLHTQTDVWLQHILCNSFGFGGNDSSLVFSRADEINSSLPENNLVSATQDTKVYIRAAAQISCQEPLSESWMQNPVSLPETRDEYVPAINPDFKKFLSSGESRRLSNVFKRAWTTSHCVLEKSGITKPDAIITGTGMGCIFHTERFLEALCREGEELLSPTHFMQSTHNSIGSFLAIRTGSHGYNTTYSHRGASFDIAFLDGCMQLASGKCRNVLVGGHDEMSRIFFSILKKTPYLSHEASAPYCETSVSLLLDRQKESALCEVCAVESLYRPTPGQIDRKAQEILRKNHLVPEDISAVIWKKKIPGFLPACLSSRPFAEYVSLFGENYVSSGIGIYIAAQFLQNGFSESLCPAGHKPGDKPSSLFLINSFGGKNITFILLKKPCGK